jgi:hypothetical protein
MHRGGERGLPDLHNVGYFSDPDGHLWEIAYGDCWQFNDDGSLVIE